MTHPASGATMSADSQNLDTEKLRQKYNAAIANGLILRARRIGRVLDAIEKPRRAVK